MSLEQTLLSTKEVQDFLNKNYKGSVVELRYISGGKHSEAFSYVQAGKNYIIRFNPNNRGFLKDQYAYNHIYEIS